MDSSSFMISAADPPVFSWGGPAEDYGYGVEIDTEGNIYAVGDTYSYSQGRKSLILVKWDKFGNRFWNKTWINSKRVDGRDIALDNDGNIYTVGTISSDNVSHLLLCQWDYEGNQQWNRIWGDNLSSYGFGVDILHILSFLRSKS